MKLAREVISFLLFLLKLVFTASDEQTAVGEEERQSLRYRQSGRNECSSVHCDCSTVFT